MTEYVLGELRGMMFFAQVAQSQSFSDAARRLGVSRSVVSYQIKSLEERTGARLLNRNTRHVSLTAIGRQYAVHCKRMVSEAQTAHSLLQNLRDDAVGRLAIACPANLGLHWLVPIVNQFRRHYPGIELEIQFSDSTTNLVEQGIDLAIRAGPLPDSDLKATKLATVSRHLCASREYLQNTGWPETPEDLTNHQWVIYDHGSTTLALVRGTDTFDVIQQGALRVNSAAARVQFTLAGHGVAVLPIYDVHPYMDSGQLQVLLPEYQLLPLELYAVFPSGSTTARATQLMLEMLRESPPGIIASVD